MSLSSLSWSSSESMWCRWRRHALATPDREAIAFVRAGEPTQRWTWGALLSRAQQYARWLVDSGVRPGQVCAIISRHHFELYPLYLAISGVGAIPSVLAYPGSRLHPEKFRAGLVGMSEFSGLDWVLTEQALSATVSPLVASARSSVRGVLFPFEADLLTGQAMQSDVEPRSAALLQHSSGTTGLQKGVLLSHRTVLEHVRRYASTLNVNAEDRIVSWLPLYHDMGLIAAFHLPLALGVPTIQIDPFEWVSAPILLPETLHHERGTLTWLPNFAYALMGLRLREEELEGLSLRHVRMFINCSEPVRDESHQVFLRKLGRIGVDASKLATCYAMAETAFAVTQSVPQVASRVLEVSRSALGDGVVRPPSGDEKARVCVSSGRAIEGCEVRVLGLNGESLSDGQVGEIVIRSHTMFDGYRNRPDKTEEVLKAGWLHTGDWGFRMGSDWFVVGRKKDLIIVAGKNVYPEDIEAVVSEVEGVSAGRVVAFGREDEETGTERACVVLETSLSGSDLKELRAQIVSAVQRIDVTLSDVYFAPPRWLIKSSAGKLSRAANRERALAELDRKEPS